MKTYILHTYIKNGKLQQSCSNILYNKNAYDFLLQSTEFLPIDAKISERIYCLYYSITNRPICKCTNFLKFISFMRGYSNHCGYKCSAMDELVKNKRCEYYIQHFGVTHNSKIDSVVNKRKVTWIKKYGVDNPTKSRKIKNKVRNTFRSKYGVNSVGELHDNLKNSLIKKYNVTNVSKLQYVKDKVMETKIKNNTLYSSIGKNSSKFFENVELILSKEFDGIKIVYGKIDDKRNVISSEYYIKTSNGVKFLDCYCEYKNKICVLEYDEKHHFTKSNLKKDKIRQKCIKDALHAKVIRFSYNDADAVVLQKIEKIKSFFKKV